VRLAHTVFVAGTIGNRIWHDGEHQPEFKLEIAGVLIFLLIFVLVSLTFFSVQLTCAKRKGLRDWLLD